MTMDPNEYDLDELRETNDGEEPIVGAGGEAAPPPGGSSASSSGRDDAAARGDEVVQSSQYRELLLLQSTTDGVERPYLSEIPGAYGAEITVFEWLEFLVDKAGVKRTLDAFRYYRTIGWITEGVEDRLRDYLSEIDEHPAEGSAAFGREDHLLSLTYIARLAAMDG